MKKTLAYLSFIAAAAFGAIGLLTPPVGEIDYSVLMLVAQFLLFCATLLGVDSYLDKMRDLMKR